MPAVGRKGSGNHTQSVIFSKAAGWTKASSRTWLKSHKYYTDGYDETENTHRWRQYDPEADKFRYRSTVIKKKDGKPSITLLLAFPKGRTMMAEMIESMGYDEMYRMLSSGLQDRSAPIEERGPLQENAELSKLFSERVGLKQLDDVFVFNLHPSTQALDSYGTRMSAQALETYSRNAIEGVPFMNSHKTGGWFSDIELALGWTFDGRLTGTAVDEAALLKREEVPSPEEYALVDQGLVLETWDYLLRNHWPNGRNSVGTDDVIKSIEGRVQRDISIGFGSDLPNRIRYVCGLCGNRLGQRHDDPELECKHVPFVKDKESGLFGFAWIYGSRMWEHSAVWRGATPGAVVNQARRMADELSGEEVDFLEDLWQLKVRKGNLFPLDMSKVLAAADQRVQQVQPLTGQEDVGMGETVEEVQAGAPDGEGATFSVPGASGTGSAVNDDGVTGPTAVPGELEDLVSAPEVNVNIAIPDGMVEMARGLAELAQAVGEGFENLQAGLVKVAGKSEADVQELRDMIELLESNAEARVIEADAATEEDEAVLFFKLLEDAVAARVRAFGGRTFDTEEYEKRLACLSPEQILAETREHEMIAQQVFKPGRVTSGAQMRTVVPSPLQDQISMRGNVEQYKV